MIEWWQMIVLGILGGLLAPTPDGYASPGGGR